ncbi:MAG: hypothetical protein K5745_08175, partial [Saccharofermentans sp.]|nr:hypothetical protein [Saccharofermentans sp.]
MRKYLTALTLCAFVSCMFFAGCTRQSTDYPSLPSEPDETQTTAASESEEDIDSGIRSLSVALPYSSDTIDLLVKLYYAKETGSWDETYSGSTVDLTYLDSISTNIVVNSFGV